MKHSVLSWLQACEEDLAATKVLMQSKLATGAACFHAQQCVEKSFKAVLEEYTKKVPKIHDLNKLLYEVEKYITVEVDTLIIDKLNMLYIESRYPGAFGFLPEGKPGIEDVEQFYDFAKYIYKTIKAYLEQ